MAQAPRIQEVSHLYVIRREDFDYMKDFLREYISGEIQAIINIDFEEEFELENYFRDIERIEDSYMENYMTGEKMGDLYNELQKAWHEKTRNRICKYFANKICDALEYEIEALDEMDFTEEEKNFLKKIFGEEK